VTPSANASSKVLERSLGSTNMRHQQNEKIARQLGFVSKIVVIVISQLRARNLSTG
jgi:hypothetical protein